MIDPKNPSGALIGDPRYGLNEEELKQYYMKKSPCWYIHFELDLIRGQAVRSEFKEEHLSYLQKHADQIRFSGPLLNMDGDEVTGGITLLDAPDRDNVTSWVENEPYYLAGAFSQTEIVRWSSSMEIRQLEYPRTTGWQQFCITALDGPEADQKRNAFSSEHHKYQAEVMDRYVARGPLQTDDGSGIIGSLMIVEYPNLEACKEFWTNEPHNSGKVFDKVKIERWRYGQAIG